MTKLLIGCGADYREGWLHHDRIAHSSYVDVAHDLEVLPWPFETERFSLVVALDVLEHISNTIKFMDECWRILEVGGTLILRVPDCRSRNAWVDPTHLRAFHPDTFTYFDPRTPLGKSYGRFYTSCSWDLIHSTLSEDGTVIEAELRKVGDA